MSHITWHVKAHTCFTAQQNKVYEAVKGLAKDVSCFEVHGVLFKGDAWEAKVEFAYNNPLGGDFYVWCQQHRKMYCPTP